MTTLHIKALNIKITKILFQVIKKNMKKNIKLIAKFNIYTCMSI